VDGAAEEYLATPPPPPEAMFDFLYQDLPVGLEAQRLAAIRESAADA
jgi:pyruvate dehydrogenase E1 component alpha subunit